jgi:hypothetical protein
MEEQLFDMYMSLPDPSDRLLYIKGYTEALSFVKGVKVVPSQALYEEIPFRFRRLFDTIQLPCYYIPIKKGSVHYGFILKGLGKETSRFCTYYPFFNLDALLSSRPYVFVVEGVKDAGIFLSRGQPVLGMLTSGMSEEHAGIFAEHGKVPVFVPDNDPAGHIGMKQMQRHLKKYKQPFFCVSPKMHKDMGDFYDHPELSRFVESTYVQALSAAESLNTSSLIRRPV